MISELEKVVPVWSQISDILAVPHNEEQYKKLVFILDALLDEVGEKEDHHLAGLMETIGNLIESYENQNHELQFGAPIEVLKELMEENNLTQKDLAEIGSQGVVSEILNGKRILNVRQIKVLSERFHVSPSVFI